MGKPCQGQRAAAIVQAQHEPKVPARQDFDWWIFWRRVICSLVAMGFMLMVIGMLLSGSVVLHQVVELLKTLKGSLGSQVDEEFPKHQQRGLRGGCRIGWNEYELTLVIGNPPYREYTKSARSLSS